MRYPPATDFEYFKIRLVRNVPKGPKKDSEHIAKIYIGVSFGNLRHSDAGIAWADDYIFITKNDYTAIEKANRSDYETE